MLHPPDYRVQLDTLSRGFDGRTCWVQCRAGAIPPGGAEGNALPVVVLTMQKLLLSGSDVFYELTEMRSDDLGASWSPPLPHPQTLGRRREPGDIEVVICDATPRWHAASGRLLSTGHSARYVGDCLAPSPRRRETAYTVYEPRTRTWQPWRAMAMPDSEERFYSCGAGCTQRYDLPDGDILLPLYFRPRAATDNCLLSTVARCRFDGETLTYLEHGSELACPQPRGLGEPSLTRFDGRFFLTLRNDERAYVTSGADGLGFDPPRPWTFDDGTELGSYNTQQHWVTHSEGLFLVYTRRGLNNDHVFRHRAPLVMAQVDPERLCVRRATERVLVPERGARLGNFAVTEVSERETWVTVSEWMQTWGPNPSDYTICQRYGSDNSVYAARIVWEQPNKAGR